MAQVQVITNEGLDELVALWIGGAASIVEDMVVCKTACPASTASGLAQVTQSADAGLTMVSAATVTTTDSVCTNDTVLLSHPFTASGSETCLGFVCANTDDDVAYGICSFASDINVEVDDTLTLTMQFRAKNG